jgi:hypothetical protein
VGQGQSSASKRHVSGTLQFNSWKKSEHFVPQHKYQVWANILPARLQHTWSQLPVPAAHPAQAAPAPPTPCMNIYIKEMDLAFDDMYGQF